jgi:hypothetical protein
MELYNQAETHENSAIIYRRCLSRLDLSEMPVQRARRLITSKIPRGFFELRGLLSGSEFAGFFGLWFARCHPPNLAHRLSPC